MKIICSKYKSTEDRDVFYIKPDTALSKSKDFYIPEFTEDVSCRLSLVVKITKGGKYIQKNNASKHFDQFALGLTFVAEDLFLEAKEKGLPWEMSHAFDGSFFVGDFSPQQFDQEITFSVKNKENIDQMILPSVDFNSIISKASEYFTLRVGDFVSVELDIVYQVKEEDVLSISYSGQNVLSLKIH